MFNLSTVKFFFCDKATLLEHLFNVYRGVDYLFLSLD